MAKSRTQMFSLRDFTGGLNLNADTFRIAENESPDMLNVDVDKRGGFQVRRGFRPYSPAVLPGDPDSLWAYGAAGSVRLMCQRGAKLYGLDGGTWTEIGTNLGWGDGVVRSATFNSLAYVVRGTNNSVVWDGSAPTTLGNSFNDTTVATSGNMPKAKLIAAHAGYLWVAGTTESSVAHPSRVRWSWANTFDNSGENWRTDDYIDVDPGVDSDEITAIVPYGDQLVVFKRNSVYAIYGYSAESFSVVNVSNTVGAVSQDAVVATPSGLFFFDESTGLNVYKGKQVSWAFEQIWPALREGAIGSTAEVCVGWINNRLWVSTPWEANADVPRGTTFVYDPHLGRGSWTRYSIDAGPYIGDVGEGRYLSYIWDTNTVYELDVYGQYFDDWGAGHDPTIDGDDGFPLLEEDEDELALEESAYLSVIDAYYRTRWIDLGNPSVRKRWKRVEAVLQRDSSYELPAFAYADYDPSNEIRSFAFKAGILNANAEADGAAQDDDRWDDSLWDQAMWAGGNSGWAELRDGKKGEISRASNLGVARAVSLKIGGPVEVYDPDSSVSAASPAYWAVDALLFKYVPRRTR